jgi:hypothetical protein
VGVTNPTLTVKFAQAENNIDRVFISTGGIASSRTSTRDLTIETNPSCSGGTFSTPSGGQVNNIYYNRNVLVNIPSQTVCQIEVINNDTNYTGADGGLAATWWTNCCSTNMPTGAIYDIEAYAQGSGAPTNPTPTPPGTPTKTSSTFNSISIAWAASSETGGTIANYKVFMDGSSTALATVTGTSYTATGLSPNTSHTFTVTAYDSQSPSVPSNSSGILTASSNKIGDLDSDGQITGHDLSIILTNYNTNYPPAEFDGTPNVEGHDLSMLLSNYGK